MLQFEPVYTDNNPVYFLVVCPVTPAVYGFKARFDILFKPVEILAQSLAILPSKADSRALLQC